MLTKKLGLTVFELLTFVVFATPNNLHGQMQPAEPVAHKVSIIKVIVCHLVIVWREVP